MKGCTAFYREERKRKKSPSSSNVSRNFQAARAIGTDPNLAALSRFLLCCNKSDTFRFMSEAACRFCFNFEFNLKL